MKRKFEEKVAQLAFGDLSAEESAKLEREVHQNPEALRALSQYKEMRDGLRSLSDIPEDQFSKERLRDAILTQGLKPRPTRPVSNRSWLWMPSAACTMGFVLMFAVNHLHRHVGAPNLLINPPKNYTLGPSFMDESKAHSNFEAKSAVAMATKPHAKPTADLDAVNPQVDPDIVDSRITASNLSGEYDDAAYDPDLGTQPASSPKLVRESTVVPRNSAILASTTPATGPIVLIDQDKDEQTGACKATEVGSASNVLVGG